MIEAPAAQVIDGAGMICIGPLMEPEDSYRSVRLGAAAALAAGVTTVHNWSHNTRSPEHGDAELSGMRDMGIRGRFAYGTPVGMADDAPMDFAGLARQEGVDARQGQSAHAGHLLAQSRRPHDRRLGGGDVRGGLTIEQIKRDWDGARAASTRCRRTVLVEGFADSWAISVSFDVTKPAHTRASQARTSAPAACRQPTQENLYWLR
jgi:hypothetical protein